MKLHEIKGKLVVRTAKQSQQARSIARLGEEGRSSGCAT
jgi:hypothetical protein